MDTIPGQNCCITDFHLNICHFVVSYYLHFRCHFSLGMDQNLNGGLVLLLSFLNVLLSFEGYCLYYTSCTIRSQGSSYASLAKNDIL
jgi:hypothetical protein